MVKNLAFEQNVNRPRAWQWLKARLPQQNFAVLGYVNGEARSKAQQGVHGGVSRFQMKQQVWVKARSKIATA